jgi:hypothetical protein
MKADGLWGDDRFPQYAQRLEREIVYQLQPENKDGPICRVCHIVGYASNPAAPQCVSPNGTYGNQ